MYQKSVRYVQNCIPVRQLRVKKTVRHELARVKRKVNRPARQCPKRARYICTEALQIWDRLTEPLAGQTREPRCRPFPSRSREAREPSSSSFPHRTRDLAETLTLRDLVGECKAREGGAMGKRKKRVDKVFNGPTTSLASSTNASLVSTTTTSFSSSNGCCCAAPIPHT
jgi:hypothetical protein